MQQPTSKSKRRNPFWSFCLYGSLFVLPLVVALDFYGLYTDRFYFFKIDNYILPAVTIVHLVYLYAIRFKIREGEYPDMQLRNVEFGMYAVLAIYFFKCLETSLILLSADQYSTELIPKTFVPMGAAIISLQGLLILLTIMAIILRRHLVGYYDIDYLNENVDPLP